MLLFLFKPASRGQSGWLDERATHLRRALSGWVGSSSTNHVVWYETVYLGKRGSGKGG